MHKAICAGRAELNWGQACGHSLVVPVAEANNSEAELSDRKHVNGLREGADHAMQALSGCLCIIMCSSRHAIADTVIEDAMQSTASSAALNMLTYLSSGFQLSSAQGMSSYLLRTGLALQTSCL